MRTLKTNSCGWVHREFDSQGNFGWQTGYGAFAVSHSNLNQVKEYIRNQEEHHRRVSFQEEYVAFLERHGVKYDDKYLWE